MYSEFFVLFVFFSHFYLWERESLGSSSVLYFKDRQKQNKHFTSEEALDWDKVAEKLFLLINNRVPNSNPLVDGIKSQALEKLSISLICIPNF